MKALAGPLVRVIGCSTDRATGTTVNVTATCQAPPGIAGTDGEFAAIDEFAAQVAKDERALGRTWRLVAAGIVPAGA